MTRTTCAALITLATAAVAGPASAEALVGVSTSIGPVMAAASNDMTLYTFSEDAPNTSNCYDGCAGAWPPFLAAGSAQPEGGLGIIQRRDGTRQWALDGQPLYFWQGDQAPGDVTGHGVGGVWFAAQN